MAFKCLLHHIGQYIGLPLNNSPLAHLGVHLLLLHVLLLPAVDDQLLHGVAPQLLVEGEHHDHEAERGRIHVTSWVIQTVQGTSENE